MNGQALGKATAESADRDIEQLMKHGMTLHDQAIFEALRGIKNSFKAVLTKWADFPVGANRLKQHQRVKLH